MRIVGVRLVRPFSPYKYINQAPVQEVFQALKVYFKNWGKPLSLRVDNGMPLGSSDPSTTPALALALIGYGIEVKPNRPHTPQQNGKVERQQGTSIRWAEVEKCLNIQCAQEKLDEACTIQREKYPVTRLKGQTRLQVFPQLKLNDRKWDDNDFNSQRVYDFLAKKTYVRKVGANGQITLFAHAHHIGQNYKHQHIVLKFDPFVLQWAASAPNGQFIKAIKVDYLSEKSIKDFTVFSKN